MTRRSGEPIADGIDPEQRILRISGEVLYDS
jgi:hypothetical protein